jgi:hypothetical protein
VDYHQHLLAQIAAPPPQIAVTASSSSPAARPESPKLVPRAGSPGPVTPLELADAEGYMGARAGTVRKDRPRVADAGPPSCRASA